MKWDEKRSKLVDLSRFRSLKCQKSNVLHLFPAKILSFFSYSALRSDILPMEFSSREITAQKETQSKVIKLNFKKKGD